MVLVPDVLDLAVDVVFQHFQQTVLFVFRLGFEGHRGLMVFALHRTVEPRQTLLSQTAFYQVEL